MGEGDKGEIKNILLQIDRINYKPESLFQESLEVPARCFLIYLRSFIREASSRSFVDFTGRHKTLATSRGSHGVAEHTNFIKISVSDRLVDCFNIFPSTF